MIGRLDKYLKNLKFAVFGHFAGLFISFVSRYVFIKIFNAEYLGINGLFSNILMILSLAELGVGQAIVFSLYKPLAERDDKKVIALMQFYKKTYTLIGLFVITFGLVLTPFLDFFIKKTPNIDGLKTIFILFIINSSLSYFFSYKRSLIIADQKGYIDSKYHIGFYSVFSILQIIFLYLTRNYFIFLIVQICGTFMENFYISKIADKMYPGLDMKQKISMDTEERVTIKKNIKAMIYHKIGYVAVMGTDNLLLSKLIGITIVGLYSNYLLIINSINNLLNIVFQSVTSSVGNLRVTESKEKSIFIFECMNLFNNWIYAVISLCILIVVNPFLKIWIGSEYLLTQKFVIIIVLNFYLTGLRKNVLTFRNAYGLYWQDRYKPLFEATVNLVVSYILAKKIGAMGIFIGTTVSTLTTSAWVEPYILYKYAFKRSVFVFFGKQMVHTFIVVVIYFITKKATDFWIINSFISLVFKSGLIFLIINVLLFLFYFRSKEFAYLKQIILNKIKVKNL